MHWCEISCRRLSSVEMTRVSHIGSPRRGKRAAFSLRGTALKRRGPNPTFPGAFRFNIEPGSNLLEEMGGIEDLAAEMRTARLTLDDHMLYIIFINVLPAEYEVEARSLASGDSIGRDEIIKAVRERHH